jgi:hypothetical protein
VTVDHPLEDAANHLELVGGAVLSQAADFLRRIELERSDAARKVLEDAAKDLESRRGGDTYQKAFKTAAALLRSMKARV